MLYTSSVMIRYPFFKKYVTILILVTLVLLPAAAGICYWVNLYYPFKIAFLIFFAIMFFSIISILLWLNFQKCPQCGCHSMGLQSEAIEITSIEFVYQHMYLYCRNCGCLKNTDLALKSNIFIKKIPIRLKNNP